MMDDLQLLAPPQPKATSLSNEFWKGCNDKILRLQSCEKCKKLRFYPAESCPNCGAIGGVWTEVSGRGTIYSWIVVHKSPDPYWKSRVPYISAIVELVEQKSLFVPGLLSGVEPASIGAGMQVGVWFEDMGGEYLLPRWRPAKHS